MIPVRVDHGVERFLKPLIRSDPVRELAPDRLSSLESVLAAL
jgi:hypothetical protein